MKVDPSASISPSSSSVELFTLLLLDGHMMLQDFLPSGRVTVVEYKIIGTMRNADRHHATTDTIFDTSGVRKRGLLIGWQTAINLLEELIGK